jgi:hypothetical protein
VHSFVVVIVIRGSLQVRDEREDALPVTGRALLGAAHKNSSAGIITIHPTISLRRECIVGDGPKVELLRDLDALRAQQDHEPEDLDRRAALSSSIVISFHPP